MHILELLGDFLLSGVPDLFFSEETKGREVALWFGLAGAMEACAAAFGSTVLAIAGVTMSFAIVWVIHQLSEKYSGFGGRFDLRQSLFYTALLAVLAACLIDQGAGLLLRHGPGETIVLGRNAQFAVAAAFPLCLLVLWFLPNRIAAIGAGLILGGMLSKVLDQALARNMMATLPNGSFNVANVTLALGALLLLAGLSLPRAKPERETRTDLRQV